MSQISMYVDQFNQLSHKTAEAVIEMGAVVFKAKNDLSDSEFAEFCDQIRYKPKSSAIRKFQKIGKAADYLKVHVDKLPTTWTTIYHLAQLSSEVFEKLVNENRVFISMSGSEAKQLVDDLTGRKKRSIRNKIKTELATDAVAANQDNYEFTLHFDTEPTPDLAIKLERFVQAFINKEGAPCAIRRSNKLNELCEEVTSLKQAA